MDKKFSDISSDLKKTDSLNEKIMEKISIEKNKLNPGAFYGSNNQSNNSNNNRESNEKTDYTDCTVINDLLYSLS